MKTNKIKADCLVAFIHSRLIGLRMDKNQSEIKLAFNIYKDYAIYSKARYE